MPKLTTRWPQSKVELLEMARLRIRRFCEVNQIPEPTINVVSQGKWRVDACAYYRPTTEAIKKWATSGINICLEECQVPCPVSTCRNWSWPASVTDREPFGVICHELGHHCDWLTGERKWTYGSEYCEEVMKESEEPPVTSYCPNPAEWFAEMFRIFVTNADLLRHVRPKTYEVLIKRWKPVSLPNWLDQLGVNVPERVVKTLVNKGAVIP